MAGMFVFGTISGGYASTSACVGGSCTASAAESATIVTSITGCKSFATTNWGGCIKYCSACNSGYTLTNLTYSSPNCSGTKTITYCEQDVSSGGDDDDSGSGSGGHLPLAPSCETDFDCVGKIDCCTEIIGGESCSRPTCGMFINGIGTCACGGITSARCDAGYWGLSSCTLCPAPGTSVAGALMITDCYISMTSGSDDTGSYTVPNGKCYYAN